MFAIAVFWIILALSGELLVSALVEYNLLGYGLAMQSIAEND